MAENSNYPRNMPRLTPKKLKIVKKNCYNYLLFILFGVNYMIADNIYREISALLKREVISQVNNF